MVQGSAAQGGAKEPSYRQHFKGLEKKSSKGQPRFSCYSAHSRA